MKWKEPEIIHRGSCRIVIHRPDLSAIEQTKTEQMVQSTLEAVMRNYIRRKEYGHGKNTSGAIPKE